MIRSLAYIRICFLLFITAHLSAQSVSGIITDAQSGDALTGVNIVAENNQGTSSDAKGDFTLTLSPGDHALTISFIGYETQKKQIVISENKNSELNIQLHSANSILNTVVVSGSLYEKKLSEETVSMDVIKPGLISNTNSVTLADAIVKTPGVYMLDQQVNIRGGTGFTYGAGSRVMLVVDDQILLAADRGDAKWNFIPMENVDQIEIIKGASSVLYGSSALNGVISVRTAWPGTKPESNITIYHGFYGKPSSDAADWYDNDPTFSGVSFSHRQKFNKFDLVVGGNLADDNSYLEGQYSSRARINWKTRFYTNHQNLTYGINGNAMMDNEGTFFLWSGVDTGAYLPFGGYLDQAASTLLNWQYKWLTIDPWLNYYDKHGNSHHFKMRLYNNNVNYSDTTGGDAYLLNADYQFHREFENQFFITAGATGYYFNVNDDQIGIHKGFSGGIYGEVDKKLFSRLTLDMGLREEVYQLDSLSGEGVPIFKAGVNYQVNNRTFLRASFGQGYRFPSLVEKYVNASLGILNIFPNPDLKPEYGWNAELGIKRTVSIDQWTGYADAAFYITDYFDMTEFTFNFYDNGSGLILPGFKSINVTRARVGGIELELNGEGELFGHHLSITGGYNYAYPADIGADSSNLQFSTFMHHFFEGFTVHPIDSAFLTSVLKYRFRNMFRIDAEYDLKKFIFGTDINYYSMMENLDAIYINYIPGIDAYRSMHLNGDWIFDARVGYAVAPHARVELLVKNISNHMYALRVAKYDPPRNFTIQYKIEF